MKEESMAASGNRGPARELGPSCAVAFQHRGPGRCRFADSAGLAAPESPVMRPAVLQAAVSLKRDAKSPPSCCRSSRALGAEKQQGHQNDPHAAFVNRRIGGLAVNAAPGREQAAREVGPCEGPRPLLQTGSGPRGVLSRFSRGGPGRPLFVPSRLGCKGPGSGFGAVLRPLHRCSSEAMAYWMRQPAAMSVGGWLDQFSPRLTAVCSGGGANRPRRVALSGRRGNKKPAKCCVP